MKILIDEQLPIKLSFALRSVGYESTHVCEIGLGGKSDIEIAKFVMMHGYTIFTKDRDFVTRANLGHYSPKIVWIRVGNSTFASLWSKLQPLLPRIFDSLNEGEQIVEICD